ncbi:hypothetical protein N7520_004612 [Penicillium odoratum]|uniref:uncharacterized protein n=1 Tax=Penicillium odoratum TaxID=1167516 RepID=UPI002548359D|nr:uncharacterized protein N7520_004612 [Penicillium odoratum]KAJ5765053.1 hypothetical protein N7520_004612 [Penicillium odoratum]
MRVFHACLGLCLLATNVLANAWSGPYQAILLWYAYRLDVKTYGAGSTEVAHFCEGSAADGSCYFDEFLKYIQRDPTYKDSWVKWTGSTSVGDNLTPDVIDTANELKEMNESDDPAARYAYYEDWGKILPDTFAEGSYPSFSKAYASIINTIQAIRRDAPGLSVNIDEELYRAKQAMVLANDGRAYDDAQYKIAAVNKVLADKGITWEVETKQIDSADGQVWEVVDTEATIEAHPDETDVIKNTVIDYVNSWGTADSLNQPSINHAKALYASEVFQSTLLGDSTCDIKIPNGRT